MGMCEWTHWACGRSIVLYIDCMRQRIHKIRIHAKSAVVAHAATYNNTCRSCITLITMRVAQDKSVRLLTSPQPKPIKTADKVSSLLLLVRDCSNCMQQTKPCWCLTYNTSPQLLALMHKLLNSRLYPMQDQRITSVCVIVQLLRV